MEENIEQLKNEFKRIQKLGWVKSVRKGWTGVGATFESLLGKEEENFEMPDYNGIEIKTKRRYSESFTCLFNATPDGEDLFEIKRLRDTYGYLDSKHRKYKVINNEVYANARNWIGYQYQFMLKIDYNLERIYLCIFDRNGDLVEKRIYWSFKMLEEKLYRKMQVLAFVKANTKHINDVEYFKYNEIKFYTLKSFDEFLRLIKYGVIRVKFKIGVFYSGKRCGEIHDHGTGFEIEEKNLLRLYNEYKE